MELHTFFLLLMLASTFPNGSTTVCVENTSWQTTTGYRCADYAKNKWCENGGKGSAWKAHWNWNTDSYGLDARSVCCICGGKGKSECIAWKQTGRCDPNGPREPHFDKPCDVDISDGASGYCLCNGGIKSMLKKCSKGEFRNCNEACRKDMQTAKIACQNFGKDWKVDHATDRALICTKENTRWIDNCDSCSSWRMLVLADGGFEYDKGDYPYDPQPDDPSTVAGKYYGGHKPCEMGNNYQLCGDWITTECTRHFDCRPSKRCYQKNHTTKAYCRACYDFYQVETGRFFRWGCDIWKSYCDMEQDTCVPFTGYDYRSNTVMVGSRLASFSSLKEAIAYCNSRSNCDGIVDYKCDGSEYDGNEYHAIDGRAVDLPRWDKDCSWVKT